MTDPASCFYPIRPVRCDSCGMEFMVVRNPHSWELPGMKSETGICWKCRKLPAIAPLFAMIEDVINDGRSKVWLFNLTTGIAAG